jgi:carboxyl-terminal processing protease
MYHIDKFFKKELSVVLQPLDDEYARFKGFVKGKGFEYETQSELELKKLMNTAKKEKYFEQAAEEFSILEKKLAHDDNRDLDNFRKEIEELINEEILSRYYYQKGRISLSIESDKQVIKALEILDEPSEINKILAKEGGFEAVI